MKVIGGKEIKDSNGILTAYVAKIFPGGLVDAVSEIHEGDPKIIIYPQLQYSIKKYYLFKQRYGITIIALTILFSFYCTFASYLSSF